MPSAPMTTTQLERAYDRAIPPALWQRGVEEDQRRAKLKRDILHLAEIGVDMHLTLDEVLSLAAMIRERDL